MTTRPRAFPPGIPGVAWLVGLAIALVVALVAAVPHYATHQVLVAGGATQPGVVGPAGVPGGPGQPGGGQPGTGGHAVAPTPGAGGQPVPNGAQPTANRAACTPSTNGGHTAPGVTATEIHVAATTVTSGVGAGFLGQAEAGLRAAMSQANASGGICGRRISLETLNSGWDGPTGARDIDNWIHTGNVFALVGQPDSEGLNTAMSDISASGLPVVGTDGLLAEQYHNPWVFPVAASTVSNMHIIADYAVHHLHATSFGIVYDTAYTFGKEGAAAFDREVFRLTGKHIPGYDVTRGCSAANKAFCGISANNQSYNTEINNFDAACKPCDVVVTLLEPEPMETWMKGEKDSGTTWYRQLFGGEPLFDDNLGGACDSCGGMTVWTGYHPAIQPFDAEPAVARYQQSLKAQCPSCDPHNEFTEGAYIGMQLFIAACRQVAADGLPLTRANLRTALGTLSFDDGLTSAPLHYGGLPHLANIRMTAYSDNYSGSFNGWSYLGTSFVADPAPGQDLG